MNPSLRARRSSGSHLFGAVPIEDGGAGRVQGRWSALLAWHRFPVAMAVTILAVNLPVRAANAPGTNAPSASSILSGLFDDPVIARGKGFEVKRSELEEAFTAFRANSEVRGQGIPEPLRAVREAQLLERLIVSKILNRRATAVDQIRGKEITDQLLADIRKEFASDEAFSRRLKALGLSVGQFTQRLLDQALSDAVLEREVKGKIQITEFQVGAFYTNGTDVRVAMMEEALKKMGTDPTTTLDQVTRAKKQIDDVRQANLSRLEVPEQVRLQHVFLITRDRETNLDLPEDKRRVKRLKLEQILKRARSGEDFAKLVQDNTEDANLPRTKGEYVVGKDDPFPPEFKAAAFTLKTNQVSDIVTTLFGMHVIKLIERMPPRKLEFAKAAPVIKDFLLNQELQRRLPEFFDAVKQDADVQILDPKYRFEAPKPSPTAGTAR